MTWGGKQPSAQYLGMESDHLGLCSKTDSIFYLSADRLHVQFDDGELKCNV